MESQESMDAECAAGESEVYMAWSCCRSADEKDPGCKRRPHQFKVMIAVRAETNPPTRVENVEISVVRGVDISIFPGADYDLQLEITNRVVEMMHEYFNIDRVDMDALAQHSNRPSDQDKESLSAQNKSSGKASLKAPSEEGPQRAGKAPIKARHSTVLKSSAGGGGGGREEVAPAVVVANRRQECVYLRYIRVGKINLDVSTVGFRINVNKFKVVVEDFVDRGTVCNWKELVWSLEKHIIVSLTTHTVKNIWPWGKLNAPRVLSPSHEGKGSTLSASPPPRRAHSSDGKLSSEEEGVSDVQEDIRMQEKMETLFGTRQSFSGGPTSPSRSHSGKMSIFRGASVSGASRYLSELRKKMGMMSKKS
jgi:hypothetical protein